MLEDGSYGTAAKNRAGLTYQESHEAGYFGMINQEQDKILQLRESLKKRGFYDLSNYESDVRLAHFLKETRRNVHRACELYLAALKWRVSYGAMNLSCEAIPMENYLTKIAPIVLLDDSTTIYYRLGKLLTAIAEDQVIVRRKHIFRYMMKSFEVLLDSTIVQARGGQVLVDLENISMRVLVLRPVREFLCEVREFYRVYYPRIMDRIVYTRSPSFSPLLIKFLLPFPSDSCSVHWCDQVFAGIEKLEIAPFHRERLRQSISDLDKGLFIPMKKCQRSQESPIPIRRWNSAAEKAEAIEAQAEAEWSPSDTGDSLSSSWCSSSSYSSETMDETNHHLISTPKKLKKKVSWSDHLEQFLEDETSDTCSEDSQVATARLDFSPEPDLCIAYHKFSPKCNIILSPRKSAARKYKRRSSAKIAQAQTGVMDFWEARWWYRPMQ